MLRLAQLDALVSGLEEMERVTERDREGEEEGERDLVGDTEVVRVDTRVVGRPVTVTVGFRVVAYPEGENVPGKVVAMGERERVMVTEGEREGLRDTVGEKVWVDCSVFKVIVEDTVLEAPRVTRVPDGVGDTQGRAVITVTLGVTDRVLHTVMSVTLGDMVRVACRVRRDPVIVVVEDKLLVRVNDTLLHEDTQKVGLLLLVGDTVGEEDLVCASTSGRKEEEERRSSGPQKMVGEESRPGT